MIKKERIASTLTHEEMLLIDEACKIEQRSKANFTRITCLEKAKEILQKGAKDETAS
jgi:uncharacterized protein (DUF1778 family)